MKPIRIFFSSLFLFFGLNSVVLAQSSKELVCYEMLRGVPSERIVYTLKEGVLYREGRAISNEQGMVLGPTKDDYFARHKIMRDGRLHRTIYEDRQLKRAVSTTIYDFKQRRVFDVKDKENWCYKKPD